MTSYFVIRRQKDGTTEDVSPSKSVKTSMTNPKPFTLPPYMLTTISKKDTPVITLTFRPSSNVNKKST